MTEQENEGAEYGLVMPFVTVQSAGGPHEDSAYVAGMEMGALDAHLAHLKATDIGPTTLALNIHAENQPQADLIAMNRGYVADFEEIPEHPDWVYLKLSRAEGAAS